MRVILKGPAEGSERPPGQEEDSTGKPGSFDLLGFTHPWARSRKGNWVVKRKTSSKRLSRALRAINDWCRDHRHTPRAEQQKTLSQKVRGHCGYYGITGNSHALSRFRLGTVRLRKWLGRRNRERTTPWEWMEDLLARSRAIPVH